ncbi:ABC transporter substrate-binding protein [Brucellaceae bacterium C25G]
MVGIFITTAAHAKTEFPITIKDDRGIDITFNHQPERLAAISYLGVDLAISLGIKPVATTYMEKDREPDYLAGQTENIPKIGQRAKPNLELLSQASPDIIVAMRRYTIANAPQFEKIAPYVAYNMELLDESYKEVSDLATLFGKQARGEEVNTDFKAHLKEYAEKAPKDTHPRFQIMWSGDTPFSFHTENTAASIVAALGGDNIMGPMSTAGKFGEEISLETMLEKDPEVIFIYDGGAERPHENNPIWQQLSAVKNNRVYYVGDHWVESNGPIAREIVLKEAAHYLYPNDFPAVDVKTEAAKLIPIKNPN